MAAKFREHALENERNKWLGEIYAIRPFSTSILVYVMLTLFGAALASSFLVEYVPRVTLDATIFEGANIVKLWSPRDGAVRQITVLPHQTVQQGQSLIKLEEVGATRLEAPQLNAQSAILAPSDGILWGELPSLGDRLTTSAPVAALLPLDLPLVLRVICPAENAVWAKPGTPVWLVLPKAVAASQRVRGKVITYPARVVVAVQNQTSNKGPPNLFFFVRTTKTARELLGEDPLLVNGNTLQVEFTGTAQPLVRMLF